MDSSVLMICTKGMGMDLYTGRVVSFLTAATTTWALNRNITFRATARHAPLSQWLRFLLSASLGGGLNYAIYATLVATQPLVKAYPVLGVAAGALAGLAVNFTMSSRVVFGARRA